MVSFGNASGAVTGVAIGILAQKGSLFLTRPTLATHIVPRARLEASSEELFDLMIAGKIKVDIEQRYPLADGAQAHRDLEARKTVARRCCCRSSGFGGRTNGRSVCGWRGPELS